jgi:hypothetical protein
VEKDTRKSVIARICLTTHGYTRDARLRRFRTMTRPTTCCGSKPDGAVTRYSYEQRGYLAAVTGLLGATTRMECDAAGLVVQFFELGRAQASVRRHSCRIALSLARCYKRRPE